MGPQITTSATATATEDIAYTWAPSAIDEEGDNLTWTLSNAPVGMTFVEETGVISWTLLEGVTTSGQVTLTVTDDGSPTASASEEEKIKTKKKKKKKKKKKRKKKKKKKKK